MCLPRRIPAGPAALPALPPGPDLRLGHASSTSSSHRAVGCGVATSGLCRPHRHAISHQPDSHGGRVQRHGTGGCALGRYGWPWTVSPAVRASSSRRPARKPLVLNVWASWCTPCRTEMPVFQAVYLQVRDRVGFLGVDYLDQEGPARRLVAETGVTYPLAADHPVHRCRRCASRPPGGGDERQPAPRRDPQLPAGGGALTYSRRHLGGCCAAGVQRVAPAERDPTKPSLTLCRSRLVRDAEHVPTTSRRRRCAPVWRRRFLLPTLAWWHWTAHVGGRPSGQDGWGRSFG